MRHLMSAILMPVLLLWLLAATTSANSPVLLPTESFSYSIAPFVSVYEDSSRRLTIHNMVQRDYQLRFYPQPRASPEIRCQPFQLLAALQRQQPLPAPS